MLHLSNYQLRMELDSLKRDLEYNYGQYGVTGFNGFYNQFHVELYNWKLARCNALETYINAQFMVSRMEQQQYPDNVRPRWRSKPKRKQIMPPKNKFNYNNNNLNYVSKHPSNVSKPPNNNVTKPPNNNVTRPSNNITLPRADPKTIQTPPTIDNVQIKQEPFDGDEAFIINIKQEKPDNGYENVTTWVDDVNLNLNIKQEKVDPSYEAGQKRKCSSTSNCNYKKAKLHS